MCWVNGRPARNNLTGQLDKSEKLSNFEWFYNNLFTKNYYSSNVRLDWAQGGPVGYTFVYLRATFSLYSDLSI